MKGIIIKNISNTYLVEANEKKYNCLPRGKLRLTKSTPLVGDHVIFDEKNNYILEILERKNKLIRPPVSNIDYAVIVTSVKEPTLDTVLLDRILTIVSYNNIEPIIYLTKLDLMNNEETEDIQRYINYYNKIGYIVITDKDTLINKIKNKTVVFTGQSGAGKSTLLNKIDSTLELKTNEISKHLGRGKHTTRHTDLFKTNNCYIVDTPGFSKIDFIDMTKEDIRDNMKEMFNNLEYCKYRDCMHYKEEGCHVIELVKKNEILPSRYNNYISFIKEKIND